MTGVSACAMNFCKRELTENQSQNKMTERKIYSALDVAKWFINVADRESGDLISHLKVQKLLYYAQGWHLHFFGDPLFEEDFQAWAHGPVVPAVYQHFRSHGFNPIPEQPVTRKIVGDAVDLLGVVNEKYGIFSAKKLERMTHDEAPWKEARGGLSHEEKGNSVIPKNKIKEFFNKKKNSDGKA